MILFSSMTGHDFSAYLDRAIPRYAQDKVESGQWSLQSALALSRQGHEALLPNGLATPDNVFYALHEAATQEKVGMLWYAVQQRAEERIAYLYDLLIEPPYRRNGYASQALQALEKEAASRGLSGVALHVFGHNDNAQALYARLGYRPTNINMYKQVSSAQPYTTGNSEPR